MTVFFRPPAIFASVRFTKCVITFAFFNFFSQNFQNQCKTKFIPYVTIVMLLYCLLLGYIGIFDFCPAKNLAPNFS